MEHIIPKSVSPELAHEWNNMTNACERCNIGKGNYYDATHPFVDPYAPGVELRITAQGAIVDWLRGDQGAEITVGRLGLNRYELVTSRITRINHMRALVERWHTSASTLKQVLEETIIRETIEGEFTQTVVWLLHVHHFPLPAHLAPEGIVVDVA
ncbi:HNH endonuclease [Clavibacter michiganensis]|uniref:HNH endonuclease n=1 Tax=Clavibacter michiganensis TaxID=28447 RepID=UPI003DA18928